MTATIGTQFTGASMHPLLSDWMTWIRSSEHVWASEFRLLAGRALALASNDPFIAALARAHVLGTLGPIGLRASSLYDDTPGDSSTTDAARLQRREINAITGASWYGMELDAENAQSRLEIEQALCWLAFVVGDGIAVRVWRKGRSRWRIIPAERVANPKGRPNDDRLRDGFTLDEDGAIDGIYVQRGSIGPYGVAVDEKPVWVQWVADDGTPNVIHRKGYTLPGMFRGVSRLAPMIVMSRQLNGMMESHVAAKRLQAIHGLVVEAESPEDYQAAQATGDALDPYNFKVKGPLGVWVKPPGSAFEFTHVDTKGEDLTAYFMLMYKVQCAAVQYPVDVVLCQMGNSSLSSARAGLDQFDRTCQADQEAHISQCTAVIDRAAISDSIALGELKLMATNWPLIMAAKYQRPPKYSTDRLKDANTIIALMEAEVSGTTAFETAGLSWEDEQELRRAEAEFRKEHGLPPAASKNAAAPALVADPKSAVPPKAGPSEKPQPKAWSWRSAFHWRRESQKAAA